MEIRRYNKGDEEGIRELFALCFGREMSHEEWLWKYKGSPWGSSIVVATEGDKIIAHYGGLRMRFHFKGRTYNVFQPCDVMTHPGYRARILSRKGAMVKTGEHFYAINSMDFAIGFPSERHAILGTKLLGYTEHGYVTALSKKITRLKRIWKPLFKIETGWDSFNENELDGLWEKVKDNCGISTEKGSSYIFWRYRDNPIRRYEFLGVRDRLRKTLKAFAVFSVGESELLILDFVYEKALSVDVVFILIENTAIRRSINTVKLWANPLEDTYKILLNSGYTPKRDIPYIFKIMDAKITPVFLFENYYYRMGDYDAG